MTPLGRADDLDSFSKFRFSKRANDLLAPLSTKKHGVSLNHEMKKYSTTLKNAGRTFGDFKRVIGGRMASESVGLNLSTIKAMQNTEGSPSMTPNNLLFSTTQSAMKTGSNWGGIGPRAMRHHSLAAELSKTISPSLKGSQMNTVTLNSPKASVSNQQDFLTVTINK